jgi:hypothetical protein
VETKSRRAREERVIQSAHSLEILMVGINCRFRGWRTRGRYRPKGPALKGQSSVNMSGAGTGAGAGATERGRVERGRREGGCREGGEREEREIDLGIMEGLARRQRRGAALGRRRRGTPASIRTPGDATGLGTCTAPYLALHSRDESVAASVQPCLVPAASVGVIIAGKRLCVRERKARRRWPEGDDNRATPS